jgi:hypothetical protein
MAHLTSTLAAATTTTTSLILLALVSACVLTSPVAAAAPTPNAGVLTPPQLNPAAAGGNDALLVNPKKASKCHNITGTCLDHGFVCANEEVVPHAQRCNGVEDCADGTDEYMCQHDDDTPLHHRSAETRHAVQQASCIQCTCTASVHRVVRGQPWFDFVKHAPTDFLGLMTGTGPYAGRNCNPNCIFTLLVAFYRKTGVCRGWLCCARQRECVNCDFRIGGCGTVAASNRCYA